jgi:hypothetical protein
METTQTTTDMNLRTSSFNSIALTAFAVIGLIMLIFYFMAEIEEPEYLIYFAPIIGLLFYSSYYIINHKLNTNSLNGAYRKDSEECE